MRDFSKMPVGPDLIALIAAFPNLEKLYLDILHNITINLADIVVPLKRLTTFTVLVHEMHLKLLRFVPKINSMTLVDVESDSIPELKKFMINHKDLRALRVDGIVGVQMIKAIVDELPNLEYLCVCLSREETPIFNDECVDLLCASKIGRVALCHGTISQVERIKQKFYKDSEFKQGLAKNYAFREIVGRSMVFMKSTDFLEFDRYQ